LFTYSILTHLKHFALAYFLFTRLFWIQHLSIGNIAPSYLFDSPKYVTQLFFLKL
jgi:hypothetical protein